MARSFSLSTNAPAGAIQPAGRPLVWLLRARVPVSWFQLAVLFTALTALPLGRFVDNDFWWHLRTGRLVFESGIPRHDPFSWTASGKEWVAHEWLSEAIIYAVQSTLGYGANILIFAGATVAALALMYMLGRRKGAGTKTLVALMIVSTLLFAMFVTVRPQVFTWLLFAAFVFVLERHFTGNRAPLIALPPLMALWANLHLGFVYGMMLVGAWIAALVFERARGRSVDLRVPSLVAGACLLATFLNPHGPAILWYPARYLFDASATHAAVNEWHRPDIMSPFQAPIFVANLLLALTLISRQRPRPFLLLVTLVCVVLSMLAVRNAPFVGLLLIPVAGGAASDRWRCASAAWDSPLRVPVAVAAAVVAAVAAFATLAAAQVSGGSVSLTRASEDNYPAGGAIYVKEHYAGARLLNEYSEGGYLIDTLYPDVRVFIDGRSDFYGNAFMEEYLTVIRVQPGWRAVVEKYRVDVVLLPPGALLSKTLRSDPAWREVFKDRESSVFARQPAVESPVGDID